MYGNFKKKDSYLWGETLTEKRVNGASVVLLVMSIS